MILFTVLLLVSIIVSQNVETLKLLKDWIILKQWKEGKIGVPLSILIGCIAGISLNVGVTDAILQGMGIEYALPMAYTYFDIASSCLLLSRGSGALIDTIEKFKNAKATEEK